MLCPDEVRCNFLKIRWLKAVNFLLPKFTASGSCSCSICCCQCSITFQQHDCVFAGLKMQREIDAVITSKPTNTDLYFTNLIGGHLENAAVRAAQTAGRTKEESIQDACAYAASSISQNQYLQSNAQLRHVMQREVPKTW